MDPTRQYTCLTSGARHGFLVIFCVFCFDEGLLRMEVFSYTEPANLAVKATKTGSFRFCERARIQQSVTSVGHDFEVFVSVFV